MPKTIVILAIMMIFCVLILVQAQDKKTAVQVSATDLACKECHICNNPTAANPCLRICPRHWKGKDVGHKLTSKQGPEVVILNELENLYEPVKFSHKLHADMAEMGEGCVACHHYTPTDQSHPPCKECHSPSIIQENITKPGLKGAYHRQCMGCHQEWSGDTACEICHASKAQKQAKGPDYIAPHYLPCKEPDKKVYTTSNNKGPYVTFFHDNHSHLYGLTCSDCHRDDACITCHYQGERPLSVIEAHADLMHHKCSACHNVDDRGNCSKCHSKTERKEFNHAQATGWALSVYHQKLKCASCHPADRPVGKLNNSCNSCHSDWNSENFNHSVVGIALDEIHIEAECSDCHLDRQFEKKPDCSSCHDTDITYPGQKPGKPTKKGK
ncbi:MAG: cytochrome c3 family protein [bacterium]|nr:cytochrome c3 family protein [bacterium]